MADKKPGWLVRIFGRLTGIDAVDYWRERHAATLELLKQTVEAAKAREDRLADEITTWRENYAAAQREMATVRQEELGLRRLLIFEQTARGLYEQLVTEAAQQVRKNTDVGPKTLLGVLGVAFTEAVATVEAWRQGAPIEPSLSTNLRATLANRLLPDPRPGQVPPGRLTGPSIDTTRKRDGKAGDSSQRPDPRKPHIYEYPFSATSERCAVLGCGLPLGDPIHTAGGWSAAKVPESC